MHFEPQKMTDKWTYCIYFDIISYLCSQCSISVGSIGNSYPPSSFMRAILMADIRCLPGVNNYPEIVILESCILLILILLWL